MTKHLQPSISVVIPTKNGGPLFARVLSSVVEQHTPGELEILVVDSGSTDETLEIVRQFPQVRLLEISAQEFGHGKTRNLAVANTKGEFIAMITQDALPASRNWLLSMVSPMLSDPRIAGVFGRHIAYPEACVFTQRELEAHFNGFNHQPIVHLDSQARYASEEGYRQFLYFFSDNNAMLRRSVWSHIPYPEVDFAEDQAWARLIIEAGYYKAYAHDGAVYHSHDYALLERLQRSFDESYALGRLFGYRGGRGIRHAARSLLALTKRDIKISLQEGLLRSSPITVLRMPIDNLMRILGTYLGQHANKIPMSLRLRLSRDRRLMKIDAWSKRT